MSAYTLQLLDEDGEVVGQEEFDEDMLASARSQLRQHRSKYKDWATWNRAVMNAVLRGLGADV